MDTDGQAAEASASQPRPADVGRQRLEERRPEQQAERGRAEGQDDREVEGGVRQVGAQGDALSGPGQ